jgi:hypothetical protein
MAWRPRQQKPYQEHNMRLFLGFDDTDDADADFGTGKLVRNFCSGLNGDFKLLGIVRHQLPRLEGIPYTSNNSSACVLAEVPGREALPRLVKAAAKHLASNAAPGADPGLCCVFEEDVSDELVRFALECNGRRTSQAEAMRAASGLELHGLGGSNDGIIGAAAAVGLTRYGWSGRFIAWNGMRKLPDPATVRALESEGVRVLSVDRDPLVPLPEDQVFADGWLRPSMWGGSPVLQVLSDGLGRWRAAHAKRPKKHAPRIQTQG